MPTHFVAVVGAIRLVFCYNAALKLVHGGGSTVQYALLAQQYVKPFLRLIFKTIPAIALLGSAVLPAIADAQTVDDEDLPPPRRKIVEIGPDERAPSTRAVTVSPSGAVPGIGQVGGPAWVSQGPAPSIIGQLENVGPDLDMDGMTDDEVTGAVHVVLPHPTDPNTVYLGAVNGGIWKTTNALAPSPTWVPLTDFMPSLSVGALEFDPTDPTHQTLVAGVGRFSSFGLVGGALAGLYKTTDGGATWTHLDGGGALVGQNISAVYARGNVIMAASTGFFISDTLVSVADSGIWRSIDGGQTFKLLGQFSDGSGFRTGIVFDMEGHPEDPATVYAAVAFSNWPDDSVDNGVYRSDNFGQSWTRVSNSPMNTLIVDFITSNVEFSMFNDGAGSQVVYCAILNNGQLETGGVFRSTNRGVTWAELPVPVTNESGGTVSTNPTFKPEAGLPGGQGFIHFSIEADPALPGVVYVGGDRQPAGAGDCCGFPNAIGATDFTGRLFRGDVFSNLTDKWSHLTHSPRVLSKPLGGTANFSAPHADSREMAFDVNGNLIEGDDGGVYRRTLPTSKNGDWFSINGNLAVTEIHDIAWDAMSNVLVAGNQDTGTTFQAAPGSRVWISFTTADGGDVLIDDKTALASSTRYSSFQRFANPRRSTWLESNVLLSDQAMGASGFLGIPQFRTPLAMNRIDPTWIVASSHEIINESTNRGDTFGPVPLFVGSEFLEFTASALDYGGFINGAENKNLLWAGGSQPEPIDDDEFPPFVVPNVLVRPTLESGLLITNYPGQGWSDTERQPVDLEMDPKNGRICYVADQFGDVLRTTDLGMTWQLITTALGDVGSLRQIEFVTTAHSRYLFVCADLGVFFTDIASLDVDPDAAVWRELGTNLPNAPVWDIEFDPADNLIAIGTMGRGAWTFSNVSSTLDGIFPRAVVYVDRNHFGTQIGTQEAPVRTITAALPKVTNGGTILVAPGTYPEAPLTLNKAVTIKRNGSGIVQVQ